MSRDGEVGTLIRIAPIEQQHAPAHPGDRTGQGHRLIEVEDPRRIDQRRYQDRWTSRASVIPEACSPNACDFGLLRCPFAPWRQLIGTQAGERLGRQLGVRCRGVPYQFEKQRKRAWRSLRDAFMLQRTMLR